MLNINEDVTRRILNGSNSGLSSPDLFASSWLFSENNNSSFFQKDYVMRKKFKIFPTEGKPN
jgi:hypothetical protein